MERWPKPPVRYGSVNPSFSSTLLDAIYRSIDETDGGAVKENRTGGAPDRLNDRVPAAAKKQQISVADRWPAEKRSTVGVTRLRKPDYRRGFPVNSTSSSSDCSSYGGFSSSDAESGPSPAGLRPIRTGSFLYRSEEACSNFPAPPPPVAASSPAPAPHHQDKKKSGSIRSKFRDLRKSRAPASPGARLASFLNSLFTAAGSPRKSKSTAAAGAASGGGGGRGGEESACSTASSYSRSCLSKTPSSKGRPATVAGEGVKRSVRFYPVSVIVDEDCRPCGQKCLYDGAPQVAATRLPPAPAAMAKKRVEELLREFEDEEEEDDEGSDSSSDLFELENLSAIGGRGYRDELPVYETTRFGTNRAISHGFIL